MARSSKTSVIKRQRERKKAERAAQKREERAMKKPSEEEPTDGEKIATREDLEGYGLVETDDEAQDQS